MDDATAQLATTGTQGQEGFLRSLCSITGLPGDSWLSQAPMKRYTMVKISEDSFLWSIIIIDCLSVKALFLNVVDVILIMRGFGKTSPGYDHSTLEQP